MRKGSPVVNKIAELTEDQRKLQQELYEKFRKFTLVKVQMIGEAIDDLRDRGYSYDEMRTVSKQENIYEEYLQLNQGTEELPKWEYVYKVEAEGDKLPEGGVVIKEVKGYWLKTVIDKPILVL